MLKEESTTTSVLELGSNNGKKWARSHDRAWVCEACENAPAAFVCKADATSLCVACDAEIHSANPLVRRHHRVPIMPVAGCLYGPPAVDPCLGPDADDGFLTHDGVDDEDDQDEASLEGILKRKTQDEEHKKAGVRIEVSLEGILKCSKMRREDAAKELKVSISTLKRVCRDFGIHRWPPRNIKDTRPYRPLPVENLGQTPQLNYDLHSNQASTSVAHIKPSFQDAAMVTIRATCEKNTIKFRLSLSSRLVEMQQEVAKRLNLESGTYYIKYKDEEDVLILIACDEDLQECLHTSRSLGISSIAVLLELK